MGPNGWPYYALVSDRLPRRQQHLWDTGSIVVTTRELSPRRMGDIWLERFIMLFTQPRIARVVPTTGWSARIGLLSVPNYVIYKITLPLGISPHIAETVLNIQLLVSSTRVSDFTCSWKHLIHHCIYHYSINNYLIRLEWYMGCRESRGFGHNCGDLPMIFTSDTTND